MDKIKNVLEGLSLWHWLVGVLIVVLIALRNFIVSVYIFIKKELNLQSNLKKPVLVIKPTDQEIRDKLSDFGVPMNMERETDLLKKSGLFKIDGPITADEINTRIKGHGLIVLGYCQDMNSFGDVLNTAKQKQIPIIIYTFGYNRLADKDLDEAKQYAWHTLSNFPIRLVNEVFSILSTFQYDKKSISK